MDKESLLTYMGVIFRHLISGGVFLLVALYTKYHDASIVFQKFEGHHVSLGVVALVAGTLIYCFHRGITNPRIEFFSQKRIKREGKDHLFCEASLDLMIKRWEHQQETKGASDKETKKNAVSTKAITSWGDVTHLLFTCSFAIWLGFLVCPLTGTLPCNWYSLSIAFLSFSGGLLLFSAGLNNDIRKQIAEKRLYNGSEHGSKPNPPPPNAP